MAWSEGTFITGYRDDNSRPWNLGLIFFNTYTGAGMTQFPVDTWVTVDCVPFGVPADAVAVFLCGLMVITHGTTAETADLQVTFRAPGDTVASNQYIGQTIEASVGNGQRSNLATWVPLVDGKFQMYWHKSTPGTWPTNSSYTINLFPQQYLRPISEPICVST